MIESKVKNGLNTETTHSFPLCELGKVNTWGQTQLPPLPESSSLPLRWAPDCAVLLSPVCSRFCSSKFRFCSHLHLCGNHGTHQGSTILTHWPGIWYQVLWNLHQPWRFTHISCLKKAPQTVTSWEIEWCLSQHAGIPERASLNK